VIFKLYIIKYYEEYRNMTFLFKTEKMTSYDKSENRNFVVVKYIKQQQ